MVKHELLDWFWKKERTFTPDEVKDLVERIKMFNCGCIDQYLTEHADREFEAWLLEKQN